MGLLKAKKFEFCFILISMIIFVGMVLIAADVFKGCGEKVNSKAIVNTTDYKTGLPDTVMFPTLNQFRVQFGARVYSGSGSIKVAGEEKEFSNNNSGEVVLVYSDCGNYTKTFYSGRDSIVVGVKTYPAAEVDLDVKHYNNEMVITRVDTVVKTSTEVKTVSEMPSWMISAGVSGDNDRSDFEPGAWDFKKYAELKFNHKVSFVIISVKAGIHNMLNDGLNKLKLHGRAEVSIPLW